MLTEDITQLIHGRIHDKPRILILNLTFHGLAAVASMETVSKSVNVLLYWLS